MIEIVVCSPKEKVERIKQLGIPPCRKIYVPGETDAEGYSIAKLNPWYCEATALYWLWKTSTAEIVGLEHYRRYFVDEKGKFATKERIESILSDYDVMAIEHRYSTKDVEFPWVAHSILIGWEDRKLQAYKFVYGFILWLAKNRITYKMAKFFLEDLYDEKTLYKCNMFVCRKPIVDEWCEFMFPKLTEWMKQEGIKLDDTNKRLVGHVFEHLFGSWMKYRGLKIRPSGYVVFDKNLTRVVPEQMGADVFEAFQKYAKSFTKKAPVYYH